MKDTGQGISPEFLPYVFDRFRQANSTTTRLHGGLGLGLEIVHHLVELHGGAIHAESPGEGKGATFTVKLPLLAASVYGGSLTPELLIGQVALDNSLLDGLRVLVVDDEADTCDLVTAVLTQSGAEVTAVGSAREAIAAVEQLCPNILISDIAMPGEDGYELIRQVKTLAEQERQTPPAIALTAYARDEDRTRALAAGFQTYLSKPVQPD